MSDYLNNLVVRTLQRQEVVRPRLASHFEPSAIGPLPAPPADVETTSFGQPQATPSSSLQLPVAPPPESRPPAPPLAHLPARRETFTREVERNGLEVRLFEAPAIREREPAPAPPVPFVEAKSEDEARPPSHAQTEKPAPVVVVRHDTRDGHDPKSAAKVEGAPTVGATSGLEARLAALEVRRSNDTGRLGAGWQGPSEVTQEAPTPAAPYFSPRVAPPARGFESPPERPHITVTIGRVDVRAVFPTPADTPRPAAPRPGSTTPLAEYLKQRERGQR